MGLLLFFASGIALALGLRFYMNLKKNNGAEKLKQKAILIICIAGVGMVSSFYFKDKPKNSQHSSTNAPEEKKSCWRCGKDLSNTVQYIETDSKKYACTPCYETTMREIKDEMSAEGYTN